MEILYGRGNLEKVKLGDGFIELGLFDDLVEELPALDQLQDDEEVLGGVDNILQLYHAWMVDRLEDFSFVLDSTGKLNIRALH